MIQCTFKLNGQQDNKTTERLCEYDIDYQQSDSET